ncbi:MAG: class I SAM-dependent methyltransferase [Candidatus Binataceae bacterium]
MPGRFRRNLEKGYASYRPSAVAEAVVPMVVELLHPESVLDVGCSYGAWLKAFAANRTARIAGLDGDYIDRSRLVIAPECFHAADLSGGFTVPGERFDLALCLEVAEHLPARQSRHLVGQLCAAAPMVLFSAAPPGQGGGHHVNCQPLSYWRALFAEHDYWLLDPFRPRIRDDRRIDWWYRQNMVLFATPAAIAANPKLANLKELPAGKELEWVYMHVAESLSGQLNLIQSLRRALRRLVRKRPGTAP